MRRTLAVMLLVLAVPASADAATRSVEIFAPDGTISRADLPVPAAKPVPAPVATRLASSRMTALQNAGSTKNHIDIVIMGDGYTAAEQGLFRAHALAKWQRIVKTEPFKEYASYFNVWLVDVVSNESGVDNDPRPPTMRDTALDMEFWCQGTERALCVDETKARAAAKAAPAADQILVLANSTKYGGVGGGVATSSGGNAAASLITVHELGHSLGGLADEYDYYYRAGLAEDSTQDVTIPAPYLLYPGAVLGEPDGPNITAASTGDALVAGKLKWWRWVGAPSPDGGVVGAYEGAGYYRYGMYRPTQDSLMHTLGIAKGGNPYNAPSAEEMVDHFYKKVNPIESATPTGKVAPGTVLRVDPLRPATHALDIVWSVDGKEVASARGSRTFTATGGTITARVSDPTPFVRDPTYQTRDLSQTLTWTA